MPDYRKLEELHPELKEIDVHSAEWYRQWRDSHLKMFPESDQITRDNLDSFVREAEKRDKTRKRVRINDEGLPEEF